MNQVPPFIQQDGPVRVVRFRQDGGGHNLYVITGRAEPPPGAPSRSPISPTGRTTSPLPDADVRARANRGNPGRRAAGEPRFRPGPEAAAWHPRPLQIRAPTMAPSNALYPQERKKPELPTAPSPNDPGAILVMADLMRLLAPPRPSPATESTERGRALFTASGCALCHTPNVARAGLYSDLALHGMGQSLNDGINQGGANGNDWRTAPLWGLGDRLFLLHDGRTRDLVEAIRLHDGESRQTVANFKD